MECLTSNSTTINDTHLFPNWSWEKTQHVTTVYVCVQAGFLTVLFTAVLLNSLRGRRSYQVTGLSFLFMISDVSLAIATVIFKQFQDYVLKA